jgi:hypothetical protein
MRSRAGGEVLDLDWTDVAASLAATLSICWSRSNAEISVKKSSRIKRMEPGLAQGRFGFVNRIGSNLTEFFLFFIFCMNSLLIRECECITFNS